MHRFIRRHPYLSFLLIFNTVGQAVAFVPVIADEGVRGRGRHRPVADRADPAVPAAAGVGDHPDRPRPRRAPPPGAVDVPVPRPRQVVPAAAARRARPDPGHRVAGAARCDRAEDPGGLPDHLPARPAVPVPHHELVGGDGLAGVLPSPLAGPVRAVAGSAVDHAVLRTGTHLAGVRRHGGGGAGPVRADPARHPPHPGAAGLGLQPHRQPGPRRPGPCRLQRRRSQPRPAAVPLTRRRRIRPAAPRDHRHRRHPRPPRPTPPAPSRRGDHTTGLHEPERAAASTPSER